MNSITQNTPAHLLNTAWTQDMKLRSLDLCNRKNKADTAQYGTNALLVAESNFHLIIYDNYYTE